MLLNPQHCTILQHYQPLIAIRNFICSTILENSKNQEFGRRKVFTFQKEGVDEDLEPEFINLISETAVSLELDDFPDSQRTANGGAVLLTRGSEGEDVFILENGSAEVRYATITNLTCKLQ